jgi:hypothetical protein
MLDAQKLPSQTLEALLAFWQQHAGAHCRAGASRRLTIGPAVDFEWRTVTASRVSQHDSALMVVPRGMNSTRRTPFRSQKTVAMIFPVDNVCLNFLGFEGDRG